MAAPRVWLVFACLFSFFANAQDIGKPMGLTSSEKPKDFEGIGIFEKLGESIDLSLPLTNEQGQSVALRDFFDGRRPVSLSLVYFSCPRLCNLHLNGLIDSLKNVDWSAGGKYQVLAVSFDPHETSTLAAAKKASYMSAYGRPGSENGFHFLTASPDVIKALSEQIGFRYKWNEETKEWAHASAAVILTPEGRIARYHHGIQFDPPTLKLSFIEATRGKIGGIVEKMIWYCFKYDPHHSKYSLYSFRAIQVGGIITILFLGLLILPYWLRGRLLR